MKGTHMKETEDLPDPMITITEMHEYGYQKPDMFPLTKASALEWHRLGEKIYPLFPDGTAGDFSSREQIQMHEGIFGMRTVTWKRIQQESQIDFTEDTKPQDLGNRVYLCSEHKEKLIDLLLPF